MKKIIITLITFLLSSSAFAYKAYYCDNGKVLKHDGHKVPMQYSPVSFPAGAWRDALFASIQAVNRNPSNFWFDVTQGSGLWANGNGINDILFSSDAGFSPAMTLLSGLCYDDKGVWTETDVIFYNGESFTPHMNTSALWEYGGNKRPIITTAIHEFGHALGLDHVNTLYNVMGEDWTYIHVNGGTAHGYFGEDAGNGAVSLYGQISSGFEDVSVVHWKHVGANGAYSDHGRTSLYSSNGGNLASENIGAEVAYKVTKGQKVRTEFTFENNGRSYQSGISVGYYISTNNYITTWDKRIATRTYSLARDIPYTAQNVVTIPSNLPSGLYYLGVIVDRTGSIKEVDETNNATYIPIKVQ